MESGHTAQLPGPKSRTSKDPPLSSHKDLSTFCSRRNHERESGLLVLIPFLGLGYTTHFVGTYQLDMGARQPIRLFCPPVSLVKGEIAFHRPISTRTKGPADHWKLVAIVNGRVGSYDEAQGKIW